MELCHKAWKQAKGMVADRAEQSLDNEGVGFVGRDELPWVLPMQVKLGLLFTD